MAWAMIPLLGITAGVNGGNPVWNVAGWPFGRTAAQKLQLAVNELFCFTGKL